MTDNIKQVAVVDKKRKLVQPQEEEEGIGADDGCGERAAESAAAGPNALATLSCTQEEVSDDECSDWECPSDCEHEEGVCPIWDEIEYSYS